MCESSVWLSKASLLRTRALAVIAASIVLIVASSAAPASAAEVSALPPAEVQEVLSGIPLEDLRAVQLSELLAQLPGLSVLPPAQLREALQKAIETLAGEGGTLAQLSNPTELVTDLQGQLGELLSLPELLGLLKGESLATLLSGGLGTPEATQLLGELLSASGNPKQLIEQALGAVSPEQLDALLGTTLTGEPVGMGTVEELAGQLGTTDEGLAEALGTTTSKLPAGALALTAPLANGKTLGMLDGVEGLTLGLLGPAPKEEGSGDSGGSGSSGGPGGSGGGSSGTPGGSTTVVVNSMTPQSAALLASATQTGSGKVRILSRRVHGHAVTLIVQVPAAGTLAVAGHGVRPLRRQVSRAELVTLRATLSRAGVASLRGRAHRLRIKLRVSFAQVGGRSSSASTTVAFG